MPTKRAVMIRNRNQFNALLLYALFVVVPAPLLYLFNQVCFGYALDGLHYTFFQFIAYAWLPWLGTWLGLTRPNKVAVLENGARKRQKDHYTHNSTASTKPVAISTAVDNALIQQTSNSHDQTSDDTATLIHRSPHTSEQDDGTATPTKTIVQHQYTDKCNDICERFLKLADIERGTRPGEPEADSELWETLVEQNTPRLLRIYKHRALNFCYRVVTTLPAPVGMAFDLLADAPRRPEWDPMCEKAHRLEQFDEHTYVQYALLRAVWPTSARDLCILSHSRVLPDEQRRGFMNVTCSVEHPECPAGISGSSVIRMKAGIAGQLTVPDPDMPNITRVIQIIDGDLGGWIPASVVKHVAHKAFPQSFERLSKLLSNSTQYEQSQLFPTVAPSNINNNAVVNTATVTEDTTKAAIASTQPIGTPSQRALVDVTTRSISPTPSGTTTPQSASEGGDSAATIAALNARVRRLETQMIHLVGQWPPPVSGSNKGRYSNGDKSQGAVGRPFSFRRFFGRFLIPTTLVGAAAWVAIVVFLVKRRWI